MAQFPNGVWDGDTDNPNRHRLDDVVTPDAIDFAALRDELIATQQQLLTAGVGIGVVAPASLQAAIDVASAGDVVTAYGTFVEDVTLKPGVVVRGIYATIQGTVTFTPEEATDAIATLSGFTVTGDVTFDGTGMSGEGTLSFLVLDDVNCATVNSTGRANQDGTYFLDCGPFPSGGAATVAAVDGLVVFNKAYVDGVTITGGAQLSADHSVFYSNIVFAAGTGYANLTSCHVQGHITFGAGPRDATSFVTGCTIDGNISAGADSNVDARHSHLKRGGTSGAGTVKRDKEFGVIDSTSVGDTAIVFDVSMGTSDYFVFLSEEGATPGTKVPSVVSKSATGFTINEPTGSRKFNWMVVATQSFGPM